MVRPSVAAIAAQVIQWLHAENRFCSSLLEERVTNLILVAVCLVCLGLTLSMAIASSPAVGLTGVAVMAAGVNVIRKEGRV